jgi:hypothetical protein
MRKFPFVTADGRASADHAGALADQRHDARVAVTVDAQIFATSFEGSLRATTRDLSLGGACLATKSPIALNTLTHVSLRCGEQDVLEIPIRGCWQSVPLGDDSVLTGVCFGEVSQRARFHLWHLVFDAHRELAYFLHQRSALRDLSSEDASDVAHASRLRCAPTGTSIYRQDEHSRVDDSIYVIQDGMVNLHVDLSNRSLCVVSLGPGEVFGGLPIVSGAPNLDSAIACEDSRLIEVSSPAFSYLCATRPLAARRLSRVVTAAATERWRLLIRRLDDTKLAV